MPSNHVWVCFDCRRSYRRPKTDLADKLCNECKRPCECIGYKLPVPRRANTKGWKALRARLQARAAEGAVERDRQELRLRNELEREIQRLKQEPSTPLRRKRIAELEQRKWAR